MEAPKKLYFGESDKSVLDVYSTKESDNEVEYTRTDAFIKKVINFLDYKLYDVVATRVCGTIIPCHVVKQELFEDLEKYMEGV